MTNNTAMEKYFRENYSEDATFYQGDDLKKMCQEVKKEFERVANYPANIRKFPNEVDRMADYFKGLPSPFYPEFRYYEIEQLLKEWGVLEEDANDSRISKMTENWWRVWANWILRRAK